MEPHETINYKGYQINIYFDNDPMPPDDGDYDDVFLIHDHRSFFVKGPNGADNPQSIFDDYWSQKKTICTQIIYGKSYKFHIFPVYAYIHSGVSLSLGKSGYPFTDPWDTSFRGFILVKQIKGWSWRREKARTAAQSLLESWNDYLSGNIYGYMIGIPDDPDDPETEYQEEGGCWGFYGYPEESDLIGEAKAEIDGMIEKIHNCLLKV